MKQFKDEYELLVFNRNVWFCSHRVEQKLIGGNKLTRFFVYKPGPEKLTDDHSKALRDLLGPCSFQKDTWTKKYVWRILLAKPGEFLWIESGPTGTSFSTNESDRSGKCAAERGAEICRWIGITG